jgi:hypothetical protein
MKKNMVMLTAVLVLGGQAQAITAAEGIKFFTDGFSVENINEFLNPVALAGKLANKGATNFASELTKRIGSDVLTGIVGTAAAAKSVQTILTTPSAASIAGVGATVTAVNAAAMKAFADPFNVPLLNTTLATINTLGNTTVQAGIKDLNSAAKQIGDKLSTKINTVGSTVALYNSAAANVSQNQAAFITGEYKAQAQALANKAGGEEAQKLNTTNNTRMTKAVSALSQETQDSVSTRAVVQALNKAVASMMVQEVFGNEQIQARLDLMLQQGAVTNNQLGDMVEVLRQEGQAKTAQYAQNIADRTNQGRIVALQVANAGKAASSVFKDASQGGPDAAKAITYGTGSQKTPVPIPVPLPKTSTIPGSPVSIPVGQPKTQIIPGSPVNIPVRQPKNTTIPTSAPQPTVPGLPARDPGWNVASSALPDAAGDAETP